MSRSLIRTLICAAACAPIVAGAAARGVSPYLPLNMSPLMERRIEQLLLLADKPLMTRPIPAAVVYDALPAACDADPLLCRQIRGYLETYMHDTGVTDLSAQAAHSSGTRPAPVNSRGMPLDSAGEITGRAYYQPTDRLMFNLAGVAYDGDFVPSGTMVSGGIEYAQLDLGYRDHWLSPFSDSSSMISTQAPTIPSVTLSNYTPISFLGFQYEVFLGELSASDRIRYGDGFTAGHPKLAGVHLQLEPVSGFAVAVNRVLQFGGGERGGASFGDFFNAIYKTDEVENIGGGLGPDEQFGNQVASVTTRMVYPGDTPLSLYFEYGGEDRSYSGQTRLGNSVLSAGVDFPVVARNYDVTYEASDWQNGWYTHGIYRDGLANEGHVIGHWFGDQRVAGDAVGGRSHMVRVGRRSSAGAYTRFTYRTLQNEEYSPVDYERMHELVVERFQPWRQHVIGLELRLGRDVFGDRYGRLEGAFHLNDHWSIQADPGPRRRGDGESPTGLFIDVGASSGYLDSFLDDVVSVDDGSWQRSDFDGQPHIGLGVRRNLSERTALGSRIEWDRIGGEDLLSIRAVDYRRKLGERFAVSGFLGAGRYDLGSAAYGFYLGVGAELRDVLPRTDLAIDVRYYDKLSRDKLLESDPPAQNRSDVFYDVTGVSAYLSYRF